MISPGYAVVRKPGSDRPAATRGVWLKKDWWIAMPLVGEGRLRVLRSRDLSRQVTELSTINQNELPPKRGAVALSFDL